MLSALRNQQPDRVPAAPDISIMVPVRLTGKPFWEIEVRQRPPWWKAYVSAMRYFGIDGWLVWGAIEFKRKTQITTRTKIVKTKERWDTHTTLHTPDGDLTMVTTTPFDNSSTITEKPVKNLKEDFRKIRHFFSDYVSFDTRLYQRQKREMGEQGVICSCGIDCPGFMNFLWMFQGGLEAMTYAYYDHPDLFAELVYLTDRIAVQKMEMAIDAGAETILTGGSGAITMQSPELFDSMSLPTIRKVTRLSRQAGIISGIHSCGRELHVVKRCAEETDLDYINPLEVPPMGDCDLAEVKRKYGHKLALMGNLHTTTVMRFGTTDDVRRESLKAILAAGDGGGFVLSSGDQCGRDTPDENIFEMVRVVKEFGAYPLDKDRISAEIGKLERKASAAQARSRGLPEEGGR
jgi:uroporphyrinogen decarboxylase